MADAVPAAALSGKIRFAVDYINLLGLMNLRARGGMNPVAHAAILLFLVDWGLNAAELDEANRVFWQQVEDKTIDSFEGAAARLRQALHQRPQEQQRMMMHLAAIAELDADLTAEEAGYLKSWGETFDMRPSEVSALYDRGRQLALGLAFFGRRYMEIQLSQPPAPADDAAAPATPAP
ncbi:MAG: TerB family tellurite resistance protein [Anaerolineae bacterium]|nr:TerB family tellurite resistance protein [Anaerolineae bacterium]